MDDDRRLDGNAAAGVLREVFAFEMTTAEIACVRCGSTGRVGGQMAYMHGMGVVVRCASCDNALIRVARGGGRCWLDLQGVKYLQIEEAR
jgi:hypothetical protein